MSKKPTSIYKYVYLNISTGFYTGKFKHKGILYQCGSFKSELDTYNSVTNKRIELGIISKNSVLQPVSLSEQKTRLYDDIFDCIKKNNGQLSSKEINTNFPSYTIKRFRNLLKRLIDLERIYCKWTATKPKKVVYYVFPIQNF